MTQYLYSLSEVSHILKVQPYQIVYLLTTGQVPEPEARLANRRAFTMDDIERLAEKLRADTPEQIHKYQEVRDEQE